MRGTKRQQLVVCVWMSALLFALCFCAEAQQQRNLPKIGWLDAGRTVRGTRLGEVFLRTLRELGYIESKNITIEYRSADDKLDRLPALAGELVRLNVDVLVTTTTPAAIAAKKATKRIPIVFLLLAVDPVAAGMIDSLARPGGNITGLTNIGTQLGGKRLELLKETVPKLARVAVLYDPTIPATMLSMKEIQLRSSSAGIDPSALGGASCGRFREDFRCAKEGAPGWTLRAPQEPAKA